MLAILALNASFSFSQLLATAVAAPPPTITAPYHQSSLEGLFGFAAQQSQPLFASADERARAIACFHRIVSCQNLALMANCAIESATAATTTTTTSRRPGRQYNRPALVRLTFEYARSPESQDQFLAFFSQSLGISLLDDGDDRHPQDGHSDLHEPLSGIAEFLITNFFLPLRASSNKTPQPSPVYYAALRDVLSQEEQLRMRDFVGTPERLSALHASCLVRDRHRCVISRAFDQAEAIARWRGPDPAADDDGEPFPDDEDYQDLEVAHIIPYVLAKVEQDGSIDEPRRAAIAILNMFDVGIAHLVKGPDMNRPYNAVTLNHSLHQLFGRYQIFFDRVPGASPPAYRIDSFLPPALARRFPVTRTLFVHPTIDPPSKRLLAFHRAIAHILQLSGAGDYLQNVLDDVEKKVVRENGSTPLGSLVTLGLLLSG